MNTSLIKLHLIPGLSIAAILIILFAFMAVAITNYNEREAVCDESNGITISRPAGGDVCISKDVLIEIKEI